MLNHLKGKKVNKKTITLYIQKYKKIIKVKKRNHLKQALELCTVGKALGYFTVYCTDNACSFSFSSLDVIVLISGFTEMFSGKTRQRVPLFCEIPPFIKGTMWQQTV